MRNRINTIRHLVVGKMAPAFSQKTTSGKNISLFSFRGKYTLLSFWASWCGPCRQENPALVRIYKEYSINNFDIVSVSLDENRKDWVNAIQKDSLSWTQLSDLKGWKNQVAQQYGVNGIPISYLIDPEGRILGCNLTTEALDKKLKEIFAAPLRPLP